MSANNTGGVVSERQHLGITAQDASGMARTALQNTGELNRTIAGDHTPSEVEELLDQMGYDCVIDALQDLIRQVADGTDDRKARKAQRLDKLRQYLETKAGSAGKTMITYDEIVGLLDVTPKTAYRYMDQLDAEGGPFNLDESTEVKRLLADFTR
jgi:Mg/Co/Ni transporter MgtE